MAPPEASEKRFKGRKYSTCMYTLRAAAGVEHIKYEDGEDGDESLL